MVRRQQKDSPLLWLRATPGMVTAPLCPAQHSTYVAADASQGITEREMLRNVVASQRQGNERSLQSGGPCITYPQIPSCNRLNRLPINTPRHSDLHVSRVDAR